MLNTLLGDAERAAVVWLIAYWCAARTYSFELCLPDEQQDGDTLEACEQICSPIACACWAAIGALVGVLTL